MKNKKLERLSEEDRKKYVIFSRMGKVKVLTVICLVLAAVMFVLGAILKGGLWMLLGAVFITLFVVCLIAHSYMKGIWEKLLKETREKSEKRHKKDK